MTKDLAYSDKKGTKDMRLLRKSLHKNIICLPASSSTSSSTSREKKNDECRRRRLEPLVRINRGGDPVISQGTVHIIPTIDENSARKLHSIRKQQQFLVFYHHSLKCNVGAGNKCPKLGTLCAKQKELSKHLAQCNKVKCSFPNCYFSRQALHHYLSCRDKSSRRCHFCESARRQMFLLDNQALSGKLKTTAGRYDTYVV
jgi:hypothetical protein